jgi:hypothetical protein
LCGEQLAEFVKSEVDREVEERLSEELSRILERLESYYMGHISGAGNHFKSRYGFRPNVIISREDIDNGFRICVEVTIPHSVIKSIYEQVKREISESMRSESQTTSSENPLEHLV